MSIKAALKEPGFVWLCETISPQSEKYCDPMMPASKGFCVMASAAAITAVRQHHIPVMHLTTSLLQLL